MRGWVLIAAGCAGAAIAAPTLVPPADRPADRLAAARHAAADADRRARALEARAAAERDAAARAATEQAATVARIDAAEAEIAAAEARAALAGAALDRQRARLAARQGPVARLLAALQSLARRPAIVSVAQPGSLDDLVHVRAVLGAVTPAIRARTADMRRDLAASRALEATERTALATLQAARGTLAERRLELARLEATHRTQARTLGRGALAASDRALALGERARALVDTIDQARDDGATAAALAALPPPEPRPLRPGESAALPTAAWAGSHAPYRLPAAGTLATGFGAVSASGVRSRGLSLDVAANAVVTAPAAGRVAYARRFRDYGQIVIIDHGAGWTSLVTGLGTLTVEAGQAIDQGAPIGRAAGGRDGAGARITVELRRNGRPVNLIPLLG